MEYFERNVFWYPPSNPECLDDESSNRHVVNLDSIFKFREFENHSHKIRKYLDSCFNLYTGLVIVSRSILDSGFGSQRVPSTETLLAMIKLCVVSCQLTGIVTRACRPSGHKSHIPARTSQSYINIPMVHTRDREPVAQKAKRWLDQQEVLRSNPTRVHSLVGLPKSC